MKYMVYVAVYDHHIRKSYSHEKCMVLYHCP